MRPGEIWIVSPGEDYAGKSRAAVIVRDDACDGGRLDRAVTMFLGLAASPRRRGSE